MSILDTGIKMDTKRCTQNQGVFRLWVHSLFTSRNHLGTFLLKITKDWRKLLLAQIAYIRVSSVDQNTERQLADCGIEFKKIFTDKTSGKNKDRPALRECLEYLREGDSLHIHSIDRFARNLKDLQEMVSDLNHRGITIHFHKENLLFGVNGSNPMNKLMLQMMGAFAEFERAVIRERQREGIEKAKVAGKYSHGKGGRKKSIDRDMIGQLRESGLSLRKISEQVGCSLSSVQRVLAER
jgi:DNA invertase Pin-like site-specific DNA recombinase